MFEAAQAHRAIDRAGAAEDELGGLLYLSAVSADEKVLLGEETRRSGEYEGLADGNGSLEGKTLYTVPEVLPGVLLLGARSVAVKCLECCCEVPGVLL